MVTHNDKLGTTAGEGPVDGTRGGGRARDSEFSQLLGPLATLLFVRLNVA